MTVAISDALTPFLGDGVTKVFTYDFPITVESDMKVLLDGQIVEASEYTVSLTPKTVTFTVAPADGAKGGLFRDTAVEQDIVYSRVNSSMNVEALAEQLDKIVLKVQENAREVSFAIKTDYQDARTRFTGDFVEGDTVKADGAGNFIPGANADQLEGFKDAAANSAAAAAASEVQTGLDRVQTGLDREATAASVASIDPDNFVHKADVDASSFGFVLDEDDMASDSATKLPTQQSVKAYDDKRFVVDRTALKTLAGGLYSAVYLRESGREGIFKWDSSDLSAEVSADTEEGIYVAPASDATGTSGAWVRQYNGAVNVRWFGATGDGSTDDSAAFQAAIDNLPAIGGRIIVTTASYVIDTAPNEGTKSVFWDFGTDVQFSGTGADEAGEFPLMSTNINQLAVGPFIRSRSSVHSPAINGGIAAFNVEMLQPADYGAGNSVALYVAARSSNPNAGGNSWAINPIITADVGAGGHFQAIEVDVNNFSEDALSVKGISISGRGGVDASVGLEVVRLQGRWTNGITVYNSHTGLDIIQDITSPIGRGLLINGSGTAMPVYAGSAASIKQAADGKETIILQRFTDTSPTGYFLRAVNTAGNANLFYIDVAGNIKTSVGRITGAILEGGSMLLTGAPEIAAANTISLGAGTDAGSALPGNPVGYWKINVAGTVRKVPFF